MYTPASGRYLGRSINPSRGRTDARNRLTMALRTVPATTVLRELNRLPSPEPSTRKNGVPPDDRILMQRVRQNDADAMDELLRRHWAGLVGYATRFTDSRDAAQDIAQDTFLQLWQGKLVWRITGSPRSFLYGVARNLARNRGRRWREVRVDSLEQMDLSSGSHHFPAPTEHLEEEKLQALFTRAVADLPPRRREVIHLSRVQGMSHQEIAEVMGISKQTVSNQMSAALKELRHALSPLLD